MAEEALNELEDKWGKKYSMSPLPG